MHVYMDKCMFNLGIYCSHITSYIFEDSELHEKKYGNMLLLRKSI